jgi:hypothetical protein
VVDAMHAPEERHHVHQVVREEGAERTDEKRDCYGSSQGKRELIEQPPPTGLRPRQHARASGFTAFVAGERAASSHGPGALEGTWTAHNLSKKGPV